MQFKNENTVFEEASAQGWVKVNQHLKIPNFLELNNFILYLPNFRLLKSCIIWGTPI